MLRRVLADLTGGFKKVNRSVVIGVGGSHPSERARDRIRRVDSGMNRCAGGSIVTTTTKRVLRGFEVFLGFGGIRTNVSGVQCDCF